MHDYQSVMKLLSDNDEAGNPKEDAVFLRVKMHMLAPPMLVLRLCFDAADNNRNYTFNISVYMSIFVFTPDAKLDIFFKQIKLLEPIN